MIDKIEMSLDDIIQSNKGKGGGSKRGGPKRGGNSRGGQSRPQGSKPAGAVIKGRQRGGITRSKYTRGDVNSAWKHDMFEGTRKQLGGLSIGGGGRPQLASGKLMVSNLDYGVSDSDINELFAEFGPLKTAAVHYDRSGRSLGTADVVFERRADAAKAMKQYNGVPLDGRPMTIQLATSEVPVITPRTPKSPVQQRTQARGGARGGGRFVGGGQRRVGGAGRAGPSGATGGGRRGAAPKAQPTLEELDAELDAYTKDSIV